ncbi:serine hydrolase domain-containing protein [Sediminibacterium ginsengisoli]|uniref:CubicO group peptidase, beta-lactamase class C family n=1 Tax=Sediminibacterium ginsengisoli TaxID=413434 RepID=A0A1T4NK11_9BACT|nr:serine hydrolase domain-containing protein [Sediminibacterium ginsengisoli]SJZ79612.1 CubicO group peptidase, beta-lactamase class C family [Sediminibacterium ginsengisoli]
MKYRNLFLALLLCQSVMIIPAAYSQDSSPYTQGYEAPAFTDAMRYQRLQALFPAVESMYRSFADKNHFPGYTFGIMLDGKLVFSGAGGYTDIDKKIPATTKSMFRIASMSKSFTAMAILHLRDAGKLDLDDPVWKYIPEVKGLKLTADAPEITIRHLLTHSAGFPEDNPWGDRQLAATEKDLTDLIRRGVNLSNAAGLTYEYSNLGFTMLGVIIRKASGIGYGEYIRKNIWEPLGMNQAEWEFDRVPAAQLAHGYRWIDNAWKEEPLLHDGIYGAMGGMITSLESFSKYVALHQDAWPPRSVNDNGPVRRSSVREMHQPWRFNTISPNYKYPDGRLCPLASAYGYGLRWTRDCEQRTVVGHSGGLPGFGSNWQIATDYGIGVIFFANVTYASTTGINLRVLDTLIRTAGLRPAALEPSVILKDRQAALLKLLPDWNNATASGLFAENFFKDYQLESLKKESAAIFKKAGRTGKVISFVAENQLRGSFVVAGEFMDIRISFTLTPENPALIQEYHIYEVAR